MSEKKAVKTLRSLADLGSPEVASDVAEVVKKVKRKPFVIAKRDRTPKPEQPVAKPTELKVVPKTEAVDPPKATEELSFAEKMKRAREAKAARLASDQEKPAPVEETKSEVEETKEEKEEYVAVIDQIAELAKKMSDMGVTIGAVEEEPVILTDQAEEIRRETVINSLLEFNSKHHEADVLAVYAMIPTDKLEEILNLLNAEWGGSAKAKASIESAQKLFKEAVSHKLTKARKSVLTTQYKEYHLLAQKVEKLLGTDTVIHTLKLTEYHKSLQKMIEHHSALSQGVREMADMIAFDVSAAGESEGPDMVPTDTVELLQILLTVGLSAKNWMLTSNEAVNTNTKLKEQVARLTKELKTANEMVASERERYSEREAEIRKATDAKFGAQFALINSSGQFVGLMEDAESINPKVMQFVNNLDEALLFKTEEKMRLLYDRLRRWSKKDSKYFKLVHRRGFTPDHLSTVTVTLTRV